MPERVETLQMRGFRPDSVRVRRGKLTRLLRKSNPKTLGRAHQRRQRLVIWPEASEMQRTMPAMRSVKISEGQAAVLLATYSHRRQVLTEEHSRSLSNRSQGKCRLAMKFMFAWCRDTRPVPPAHLRLLIKCG